MDGSHILTIQRSAATEDDIQYQGTRQLHLHKIYSRDNNNKKM
jgi:hypothetical protein